MRFSLFVAFALIAAVGAAQPPTPPPGTQPAPTQPAPAQPAPTPATTGTPSPPADVDALLGPAPRQVTDENRALVLMLLDRIQKISTDAMAESKPGKLTGGKVAVDRSALDEIVADLSQVRTILSR